MSTELNQAWAEVQDLEQGLDKVELSVRNALRWPVPKGRQLPFFFTKKFVFAHGEFTPMSGVLVQDANRETKITRVTYDMYCEMPSINTSIPGGNSAVISQNFPLRPTRTGMYATIADSANATATLLFDFEWTCWLGSTERRYTNGRHAPRYNSREALGSPENDTQLLFSPKNPLVVGTAEALAFEIRPTLYNPQLNLGAHSFAEGSTPTYVVEMQAVGIRTFTYDT